MRVLFEDFEEVMQYACAVINGVNAIVTRDASRFASVEIPIVLPKDIGTTTGGE